MDLQWKPVFVQLRNFSKKKPHFVKFNFAAKGFIQME
jgi:hypothetical protein